MVGLSVIALTTITIGQCGIAHVETTVLARGAATSRRVPGVANPPATRRVIVLHPLPAVTPVVAVRLGLPFLPSPFLPLPLTVAGCGGGAALDLGLAGLPQAAMFERLEPGPFL